MFWISEFNLSSKILVGAISIKFTLQGNSFFQGRLSLSDFSDSYHLPTRTGRLFSTSPLSKRFDLLPAKGSLCHLDFSSSSGAFGEGFAIIDQGKLIGGDQSFSYRGNYYKKSGMVYFELLVERLQANNSVDSIVGAIDRFNVSLKGRIGKRQLVLKGQIAENEQVQINLHLTMIGSFDRDAYLPMAY